MAKATVRVVRLTTKEFELSDGRVYSHPIELEPDELPTREEFQEYYEHWFTLLSPNAARQVINNH